MLLRSTDITTGGFINDRFVASENFGFGCSGGNETPNFEWQEIPRETKELAFTMFDPDAPTGCGFWHWIVVNIPAHSTNLDESTLKLSKEIRNDFGEYGYGGPCPPEGDLPHRYIFTLHALSTPIEASKDTPAAQIGFQLNFKSIEKSSILGIFGR